MDSFAKTGLCSIVIGKNHFNGFIKPKLNKLLKITKLNSKHNELKHLDTIRKIEKYGDYYTIPDKSIFILNPTNKFYKHLQTIFSQHDINIFNGNLTYFYIDYAGNKELHETINDIADRNDFSFWKSYKKIINFAKHILEGIHFLHQKKIAHLDIKNENIMVNTVTNNYKIIDFGFCSKEPFNDFVFNLRGTPHYFPHHFNSMIIKPWFPKIEANDMVKVNNVIPMIKNRSLVYKIDSYCFGRVLYCLYYMYSEYVTYMCCSFELSSQHKLKSIIDTLLEIDVYKRHNIKQCLNTHFN